MNNHEGVPESQVVNPLMKGSTFQMKLITALAVGTVIGIVGGIVFNNLGFVFGAVFGAVFGMTLEPFILRLLR